MDKVIVEVEEKEILKLPPYIYHKLRKWIFGVEELGLEEMRKISSFHDEPLQGQRFGQRSIRLNRSYRAFYIAKQVGVVRTITVIEVNKHDY